MGRLSIASLTVLAGVCLLATVALFGQGAKPSTSGARWTPPHTPWGHPDLQGVWNNTTNTPLAVRGDDEAIFTEDEALAGAGDAGTYNDFWRDRGNEPRKKSLIVDPPDGKIPALTPEAKKREAERLAVRRARGDADSYLDRNRWERCLTRSLPMFPGSYNNNFQFLQTPSDVVIVMEMIHDTRFIPLDGRPHSSPNLRSWLGDSRGRWEGETLVVDTTNFNDQLDGGRFMPSHRGNLFTHRGSGETLHLVERFTRVNATTMNYEFTMDDPKTYTRPWTAVIPMVLGKADDQIFEYACHEGNYAMVDMLKGAREKEAAAKGQRPK